MNEIINYEEQLRKRFLKFTRKAFGILPKLNNPVILDIGCGSGIPSIEIQKLSLGKIIGVDIDQVALERFEERIREKQLDDKIEVRLCSMLDLDYPPESFDIIWSEGAVAAIGFEKGLKEWRHLIKPNGYMVIHDSSKDYREHLKIIPELGYSLIDHFSISPDTWWTEYIQKLETKINQIKEKPSIDEQLLKTIHRKEDEIAYFKNNMEDNGSIFYVMKKIK